MTSIQWTDETWNPVTGCTRVSEGCRHCYIERTPPFRMAGRKVGDPVQLHPERLEQPWHWRKPRRVFVNSLSDLFHEEVEDDFILEIFTVMAIASQHTFQVLTKRPERMHALLMRWEPDDLYGYWQSFTAGAREIEAWPLTNVWLGVSVEDQQTADERIPLLLQTPAAVRFVSAEPMLGPVNLSCYLSPPHHVPGRHVPLQPGEWIVDADGSHLIWRGLNWVMVGGESGPQARGCDIAWIRSMVRQCQAAHVPCFVKQLGAKPYAEEGSIEAEEWGAFNEAVAVMDDCGQIHCKDNKGGDMAEWPEDLRVREWPVTAGSHQRVTA